MTVATFEIERKLPVLSNDRVITLAPSIAAHQAAESTSDKYRFFDSMRLLDALRDSGWHPYKVFESKTRDVNRDGFQKHMVYFRRNDAQLNQVGDTMLGLALVNSHDGKSSYQLHVNMMRLRCLNGLMASNEFLPPVRLSHIKLDESQVIDAQFRVIEQLPRLSERVQELSSLQLSESEKIAFARAALELRWQRDEDKPTAPIKAEKLLTVRRNGDAGDDLFTTLNVVQENIIRGGLSGTNSSGHFARTRGVKSVNENIKLNKALWTLTEEMAKLKS